MQPVQQPAAGTGDVHAQELIAVAPVDAARGEIQPRLLADEGGQLLRPLRHLAAVQPHEIGGLCVHRADLGQFPAEERQGLPPVFRQIRPQRVQPGAAVGEGGHGRLRGKAVGLRHLVGVQGPPDLVPQHRIGNHRRRGLESRQIEGLGGRDAGDAVLTAVFRDRGKGRVIPSGERQVAVDLIRQHQDVVVPAQFPDPRQGLPVPDLPHRVVGIAEDHQGGLGVRQFPLQVLPVDFIDAIVVVERALQHPAAVVLDGVEKDVVDRGHCQHILPRRGELPHHAGDGGHHAGGEEQPLPLHPEPVPVPPPAADGIVPRLRNVRVAVDAVGGPGLDGRLDLRRRGEIHVRDPHGQLSLPHIPLGGVGAPAVQNLVKVVSHGSSPLSLLSCGCPQRLKGHCGQKAV